MTHDELLAKINGKGSADFATLKYNPEGQKDIQDVFKALCAVVKVHKPTDWYGDDSLVCNYSQYHLENGDQTKTTKMGQNCPPRFRHRDEF